MSNTFGKKDLGAKIAEVSTAKGEKLSKVKGEAIVDLFAEAVRQLVQEEGDKLTLQNFLIIEKKMSAPRAGRNPQTGETMEIPAKLRTKVRANF